MADNVATPIPAGTVLAADVIGGVTYPRTKVAFGADDSVGDVSAANPLPALDAASLAKLEAIRLILAGTLPVSGPLTSTQLASAALATAAKQDAQQTTLASILAALASVAVTGPLTSAQLNSAALATAAKQDAQKTVLDAIQTGLGGTLNADTVVKGGGVNRGNGAVGTTAVQLAASNTSRRGYSVQNQSLTATIYISTSAAATADFNAIQIGPGGYFESQTTHVGTGAISVISTETSTPVFAREW